MKNNAFSALSKEEYRRKVETLLEQSDCKANTNVSSWAVILVVALLVSLVVLKRSGMLTSLVVGLTS